MILIYQIQIIYFILLCASFACIFTIQSFFEEEEIRILRHTLRFESYTHKIECHVLRFYLFLKVNFYFWTLLYVLSYFFFGDSLFVINYFEAKIIDLLTYDPMTLGVYLYCYMRYLKLIYWFAEYHQRGRILFILFVPIIISIIAQNYFF